jgi:hypothetical protein
MPGQVSKEARITISSRHKSTKISEIKEHSTIFTSTSPEPTEVELRHVALPSEKTSRSYATVARETKVTAFKMTLRSRGEHLLGLLKLMFKPT